VSHNAVTPRLRPDPLDVFRFADTAVELRYRLVSNYVNAEAEAGEPSVPPVVRQVFNRLLHVTDLINEGRPEDHKLEGHVIASRALVERFEREWLSGDHRTRLANQENARETVNELTEYDWASIRRNPSADGDVLPVACLELLHSSPFCADAWAEYEVAVERFVDTFDPPCRTLYRLVRVLATVRYPDPATYNATLGTLPVYDDEHLIKHVFPQVRQLLDEIQAQTCFNLNVGEWFDADNPHRSTTVLFGTIRKVLRGWRGEVPVAPGLDRPRWQPANPGAKNQGVLSFRNKSATVSNQSKVISPVFQAFEDGAWQLPVPFPPGKVRGSVLQSLNDWAMKHKLPMTFSAEKQGNHHVCWWHPTDEAGEPAVAPTTG